MLGYVKIGMVVEGMIAVRALDRVVIGKVASATIYIYISVTALAAWKGVVRCRHEWYGGNTYPCKSPLALKGV